MTLRLIPLFTKCLLCFLLVSAISLPHRSSGDRITEKEKTLAMIKPDGLFGNYTDQIKKFVLESGFIILEERKIHLDEDTVSSFYSEHSSKSFFPSLVKYMTSIRAICGLDSEKNCVHGSDSPHSAAREISFFFSEMSSGVVSKHDEL